MIGRFDFWLGGIIIGSAIVAFVVYRWQQRQRIQEITAWIKEFLARRYGSLPEPLHIICTDDRLWPVLVSYEQPLNLTRHRLQFQCSGRPSDYALLSEQEEEIRR